MFAEGTVVNRKYRILAELGQGSLGHSYKAQVLGSNQLCAIKVLDESLVPSRIPRDLVEQAVLKSSELHHPGAIIWQSLEAGGGGEAILVRDFVEAVSLRTALDGGNPLPVQRAIHIARQLALVLEAAHRLGTVHGDLRPENILLCDPEGGEHVGVLDFGLARLRDNFTYCLHKLALKEPGPLLGSPQYLSPEQAAGLRGDELDSRCDIYSLGIIFWQLLTGQLPSPAGSPLESLTWHLLESTPDPGARYPDLRIHEDLNQLIRLMLAKPRNKRIASARKVIERLDAFERLDNLARARSLEVPSFSLLTDKKRSKLASKKLEAEAPKSRPVTEPDPSPAPSKAASRREAPASSLAIGAVEIASRQPRQSESEPALHPARRSRRTWAVAAAAVIVAIGLGAAGYHLRNRISWRAVAPSQSRLEAWGHRLDAALQSSFHRAKSGVAAWSQKVDDQLFPRTTAASGRAIPAGRSATVSPVAAPVSKPSAGVSSASHPSAAPAASRAEPVVRAPAQTANSAGTIAPASASRVPPEVTASLPARLSRHATDRSAPALEAKHGPDVEQAIAAARKPPAQAQPGTAAIARTVSADLTHGDSLFELGEYDQAISDYQHGLALEPGNRDLLDRIARAKRAKAAEAEYLNQ